MIDVEVTNEGNRRGLYACPPLGCRLDRVAVLKRGVSPRACPRRRTRLGKTTGGFAAVQSYCRSHRSAAQLTTSDQSRRMVSLES
jgi:hypothetical protein